MMQSRGEGDPPWRLQVSTATAAVFATASFGTLLTEAITTTAYTPDWLDYVIVAVLMISLKGLGLATVDLSGILGGKKAG
jgi:hypothetical protein